MAHGAWLYDIRTLLSGIAQRQVCIVFVQQSAGQYQVVGVCPRNRQTPPVQLSDNCDDAGMAFGLRRDGRVLNPTFHVVHYSATDY